MLKALLKGLIRGGAREATAAGMADMAMEADSRIDLASDSSQYLQFGEQMLKRCKYGWMLFSGPHIGKCFELYGEYSESEVEIFRLYVQPGDVVIDVGANIGDLSLPLSLLVGNQGRVYAYESNPAAFHTLCANLALNGIVNVKPVNALVAHSAGVVVGDSQFGDRAYIGDIWPPSIVSIDQLDIDRLRFIKLDVEGNELEVLKSGLQHINRFRPILYFENDRRDQSEELLDFVLGLGYRIFFHEAPIFQPDNFFDNPVNHWAPNNFVSLMMLALPQGTDPPPMPMQEVHTRGDWWHSAPQ